jgi:xanthine dehydrogenase small subunit
MRDYALLYINGQRIEVRGEDLFLPLANFLRYRRHQTGTKIVCAEGDCGACTVMRGTLLDDRERQRLHFQVMNSCIAPVYSLDCSHVVTIEGQADGLQPSPVQDSMVAHHGGQCGFCTPGMVMAITGMLEHEQEITAKRVQNHLTGNLCRCTGYQPIIDAALGVDRERYITIAERYHSDAIVADLRVHADQMIDVRAGERMFIAPTDLSAVAALRVQNSGLRIMAAATDVGVQINKGRVDPLQVLSLHLISDLHKVSIEAQSIRIGARVTLASLERAVAKVLPEFADFLHIFASPQIKNVATLVGNIANASPIADTLPLLFAVDAVVCIEGPAGSRQLPITALYRGYKELALQPAEWISAVDIPLVAGRRYRLYKVSQRRDLDISCVNAAFCWSEVDGRWSDVRMAYGGVGATTLRLRKTESIFNQQPVRGFAVGAAVQQLQNEITPLSDVRGSRQFRERLAANLLRRFVDEASCIGEAP